jgi:hypothetical protein
MFMPDGSVPTTIMQNGKKNQNFELFVTNQQTYLMHMWRLLDMAMSVFKWKGLPDGVDERMLEFWLLRDGFCGFFFDEALKSDDERRAPKGYAVLPMMIQGQWDMYNYPKTRTAYAVNGFQYKCDEDNSVIIFNNFLRVPMWATLNQYAMRLANIQRTIDVNVHAQRTPKIVRCNEKQRLTLLNLVKDVDEGKPWIFGDKNLDLDGIEVLDTSAPYTANEMQIYKHQLWNEALTYLGIENVNTDKKERLVSDEVINSMGDVESQRFTRLNARKQACDEINKLFGLNVDCEFRSGAYIRTANTGDAQAQVGGMQPATSATGADE